jgi:prepilin-type processing-associated H-X9-DG protein
MAASYPTSIAGFLDKVNVVDIIDASHPNSIQSEVIAIESTLGTEPNRSTTPSPTGTFNGSSTLFSTVGLRLNNIEVGVVSDAHTQYLRKAGDTANVITIGASTTKGLVIRGASSQSANLQDWQDSSSTVLARIDASGNATAASFIKTGGTSAQVLMADGSVTPGFTVNGTAKTGAYTLTSSDYNSLIQMNGAFAFTINTTLSTAPAGTQIHLLALTTGVSVTATGVTLNGTPGLKLRAAYSSATLICLASNNWVLIGDLSL